MMKVQTVISAIVGLRPHVFTPSFYQNIGVGFPHSTIEG